MASSPQVGGRYTLITEQVQAVDNTAASQPSTTSQDADSVSPLLSRRASSDQISVAVSIKTEEPSLVNAEAVSGTQSKSSSTLHDPFHRVIFRLVVDLAFTIMPCLFIVLGLICVHLNGRELSDFGTRVEEASRLGPTIYPIAFAAIASRCMRHLARWQAQRGQKLGILEQLVQSQSLAGSLEAAISLRNIGLSSFAITALWTLSPIGGQSSLRVLYRDIDYIQSQPEIILPYSQTMKYIGGLSHPQTTSNVVQGLISASLLAPDTVRSSPQDSWGNLKLPSSQYLLDSNEWSTDLGEANQTEYASLVGIPVWNVPQVGQTNFTLKWLLFDIDCQKVLPYYTSNEWCKVRNSINGSITRDYDGEESCEVASPDETFGNAQLKSNFSRAGCYTDHQLNSSSRPFYIDISYAAYAYLELDSESLQTQYSALGWDCRLRSIEMEAAASCLDRSCKVVAVRKSPTSKPDFLTPWNDDSIMPENPCVKAGSFGVLLDYIRISTGTLQAMDLASPVDKYISGDGDQLFSAASKINWSSADTSMLSIRLGQVFNSAWISSQWPSDIADRSHLNQSIPYDTQSAEKDFYRLTAASNARSVAVYRANMVWVTLLIAVSIILLLCSALSLILRLLIVAPDVLGYVSSLTRDNPYIITKPSDNGGSLLDGTDLARRLRDVRIKIADVAPDADVGHVAVVEISKDRDELQLKCSKLQKGRLYD